MPQSPRLLPSAPAPGTRLPQRAVRDRDRATLTVVAIFLILPDVRPMNPVGGRFLVRIGSDVPRISSGGHFDEEPCRRRRITRSLRVANRLLHDVRFRLGLRTQLLGRLLRRPAALRTVQSLRRLDRSRLRRRSSRRLLQSMRIPFSLDASRPARCAALLQAKPRLLRTRLR